MFTQYFTNVPLIVVKLVYFLQINNSINSKGDGSHPSIHGQTKRNWSDVMILWAYSLNLPYIFKYVRSLAEARSRLKENSIVTKTDFNYVK